jgi:hypothetical protein
LEEGRVIAHMSTAPTRTPSAKSPKGIRLILLLIGVALLPRAAAAQSYTLAPQLYPTVFSNAGVIVNGACVWTYQAGTTTPATTYSDNAGTSNSNPIRADSAGRFTAYLLAGASYKFVVETSCTPPAHGTVLRTADNVAGIPASAATVDVTGIAGETLSAGQCAYLSDGSGSKTAGQWFRCDSANTYSSTKLEVGLAPSAILSAASGTIRVAGAVTGLSSLSVGALYYASTAGALTTTPPTNARLVGQADTASSLIVMANPAGVPAGGTIGQVWASAGPSAPAAWTSAPFVDDFRLSLTTATCVPTGDVTAATTLYLTPCTGNRITLFDASGNPTTYTTNEISIAVPATTSTLYDVWVFASSGVPTLELLAWTNDTTRATALARSSGRFTKNADTTRLYVGSFRTTGSSGQTEDSNAKRYVWNMYNRVRRSMVVIDSTNSWTYTTATFRQARNASVNQIDFVSGLAEGLVEVYVVATASNSTGGVNFAVSIGESNTTTPAANTLMGISAAAAGNNDTVTATLRKTVPLGRNTYVWLEFSVATGTTTWLGAGGVTYVQSGISGFLDN